MMDESSSIRVGILGTGYIASYHADALRIITDVALVAACDLNPIRLQQFASERNIPNQFTSYPEMLRSGKIDCVHICTPANDHYRSAKQAIASGLDVYVEKPLALSTAEARELAKLAEDHSVRIGVGHNFLFNDAYKRLSSALDENQLGEILSLDIVWAKKLLPADVAKNRWLMEDSRNILFEIGPHLFAHALDLCPSSADHENITLHPYEKIDLPGGGIFYGGWEIYFGEHRSTPIRIRMSFNDGFTEHYLKVRGTHGAATVDFERNVYTPLIHSSPQMDLDNLLMSMRAGVSWLKSGVAYGFGVLSSKTVGSLPTGPFARSIHASIQNFYELNRNDAGLAYEIVKASELAYTAAAEIDHTPAKSVIVEHQGPGCPKTVSDGKVLITGAGGFIGRRIVDKLLENEVTPRAVVRPGSNPGFNPDEVAMIEADLRDNCVFDNILQGTECVIHLARADGKNWEDYVKNDLAITKRLAEKCIERGAQLIYVSSIAVFSPHDKNLLIDESTPPSSQACRNSLYARAKAESEMLLKDMRRNRGLNVVIVRPGIVIGEGSSPLHPGVAEFPYSSTFCLMAGRGDNPLPIVLVDDCADAICRMAQYRLKELSDLDGETFNIVGPPIVSANDYLEALESTAGISIRREVSSPFGEWVFGIAKHFALKIGGASESRFPSLNAIRGKSYASRFSNSHARELLDWSPCEDPAELLSRGVVLPTLRYFNMQRADG